MYCLNVVGTLSTLQTEAEITYVHYNLKYKNINDVILSTEESSKQMRQRVNKKQKVLIKYDRQLLPF